MSSEERPTTTAWISMAYPTRNYESPVKAQLRIQDRASGHLIAEVHLTADQVCDMISARNIEVPLVLASPERRAQYGMELVLHSEKIPREVFLGTSHGSPAEKLAAAAWAEERMDELNGTQDDADGEQFSARRGRDGWEATFRRWDEQRPAGESKP